MQIPNFRCIISSFKNLKNLGSQRSQHISNMQNKAFLHRIYKGKCAQKSIENQISKKSSKIILTRIPSTKVEFLMKRTHFDAYYDLKCWFLRRNKFLAPYSYFDDFCNILEVKMVNVVNHKMLYSKTSKTECSQME